MKQTDAKYKVYMHQDAMLVNPYIIYEICSIFTEKDIGMIGVAGVKHLPQSGIWWNGEKDEVYMNLYQDAVMAKEYSRKNIFGEPYQEVEAMDGVLMVTQYDVPWRSDLFTGWDFYDISQCMEFKKRKFRVVVAKQENTWCVHVGKYNVNLPETYMDTKNIFLEEYKELFK